MKVCRLISILFIAAVGFSLAQAQGKPKPNLSGRWIVDPTKSEKTTNLFEDSEESVTIEQTDTEIRMKRKFSSISAPVPFVFATDDRLETHKDPNGGPGTQTKTKWDGEKLIIHYLGTAVSSMGTRSLNVIHEFKLSRDGNTLTKKIIVVPPRNAPDRVNAVPVTQSNQEFKKVYNRAPAP